MKTPKAIAPAPSACARLLSERESLQAFRAGDRDLLGEIYQETTPRLRGLLYACGLRSAADIDDALQSTFVKAFAQPAREAYSGLSPYPAYLHSIARNLVRDLQKSGRARFETLVPEIFDQAGDDRHWARPDAALQEAEDQALRQAFLDGLSADQRQIYAAHLSAGLTERDAALKLGISRHKLRQGLAAIRRALNRFVKERGLKDA